jgi:hypothetical protein
MRAFGEWANADGGRAPDLEGRLAKFARGDTSDPDALR